MIAAKMHVFCAVSLVESARVAQSESKLTIPPRFLRMVSFTIGSRLMTGSHVLSHPRRRAFAFRRKIFLGSAIESHPCKSAGVWFLASVRGDVPSTG